MASIYLGYTILAAGLIVLIFTFILGIALYHNLTLASNSSAARQETTASSQANVSFGSFLIDSSSPVGASLYSLVAVAVLFLFGSIGYKMCLLGMRMLNKQKSADAQL